MHFITSILSTLLVASTTLAAPQHHRGPGGPHSPHHRRQGGYPISATTVANFPNGNWNENLIIRPNGKILVTQATSNKIYEVDPTLASTQTPKLVATVSGVASNLGITNQYQASSQKDEVYYVASGDFNVHTGVSTPGSYGIYKLDFGATGSGGDSATVTKVSSVPNAGVLNGLIALNGTELLTCDLTAGVLWGTNLNSGTTSLFLNDTYTQTGASQGANGIHVGPNNFVFVSNSGKTEIAQTPVTSPSGALSGSGSIFASGFDPDDFIFNSAQTAAFVAAGSANQILYVKKGSTSGGTVLANVAGPTAARLSGNTLYVSTTGGDAAYMGNNNPSVHGQIVKLNVAGY